MLLEEFMSEMCMSFYVPDEIKDYDLQSNYDEFNCVDGEEGDNGLIKYYTKDTNELVAIKTVHGGDSEDTEFTELGVLMYTKKLKEAIDLAISNRLQYL